MNAGARRILYAAAVFFFTFALYLFTLHPTVSAYRDSGDLITAAGTLGLAHPPGYPLYVLAGKAFSQLLPWGNMAYRINVFSALCGGAALLCLTLAGFFLFRSSLVLPLAFLFAAFSPALWRLSQVSEMYSFNAFLSAALLLGAAFFFRRNDGGKTAINVAALSLLGFFCGLSLGNHQTIVLLFPGLLWYVWRSNDYSREHYFNAFLFFLAGFSVYLFLPLRSFTGPVSNWGNAGTLEGFFRMLTRADYGGMRLHPEQSTFHWNALLILRHIFVYLSSLAQQFTIFGVLLGFWGIVLKRRDRYFQFLLVSLLLAGPGFIILSNLPPFERTTLPILEPHLVLANVVFVFFIAAAAERLASRFFGAAALCACVAFAGAYAYPSCNYRDHFFAYDYGRDVFKTVPKDGLIFNPDDPTAFVTTYLQAMEQRRRDIKLIAYYRTYWGYARLRKLFPDLLPRRDIASGRELERVILDHNRERYPIFAELPVKYPDGYTSYPYGLMYRLQAKEEFSPSSLPFEFYALRDAYSPKENFDFFTAQIVSYYASAYNNIGLAYAMQKHYDLARQEYRRAMYLDPALTAPWNNLGSLEYQLGNYPAAETWFRKLVLADPLNSSALYNLGLTCKIQRKDGDSQKAFKTAWEKFSHADAGNQLGLAALNAGDTEGALALYKDLLTKYPEYGDGYYNFGLALRKAHRYHQCRKIFQFYLARFADESDRAEVEGILRGLPGTE